MKKRAVERIPANFEAEFFWSDKINSGSLVDISENGMLMNTKTCPPMRAKLEITIPLEGDLLKVPAKVRRVVKKDNVYEAVGLEILDPPKKYLNFISALRWKQIKGITTGGQVIKIYACQVCHHIAFDHAPILCPICSTTIESFERAPDAIKRPDNFAELSEMEKKHIPLITIRKEAGHIDAHVSVGQVEHEMDIENHITFIDFYFNAPLMNKKCISRVSFNCERMHPVTTLRYKDVKDGVLTVISNCTSHGNWLAKVTI